eukprot:CAMPEP_0194329918 /NCGR_PEP_ID=MMETSP0171-20130528/49766_1 /TAXON_ID=218684 /ORGANISM="Corethron pennatum, Strain L29A3" /LENGTH=332 /DNA_ID=CAMNT_0039090793 /DNA_START=124 /DNA_END=1118 /DNA_ORIENTATION=-
MENGKPQTKWGRKQPTVASNSEILNNIQAPITQECECIATVTSIDSDDSYCINEKIDEHENKDTLALIEKVDDLIDRMAPLADKVEEYEIYYKLPQFTACLVSWLLCIPALGALFPSMSRYLDSWETVFHNLRNLIRFYGLPMSIDGIRNDTWEENYKGSNITLIARISAFVCFFHFGFDQITVTYFFAYYFTGEEYDSEEKLPPQAGSFKAGEFFFEKWSGRAWIVYVLLSITNCFLKKRELFSRENKMKQKGRRLSKWQIKEEVDTIRFLRYNETLELARQLLLIFPAIHQSFPFTIIDEYDFGDCLNDMTQFVEALVSNYQLFIKKSYS